MSHAQTGRRMLVGSLLTKEHLTDWMYTANARRELAHERAFDGLDVYGECRDSSISEGDAAVGMANCVQL